MVAAQAVEVKAALRVAAVKAAAVRVAAVKAVDTGFAPAPRSHKCPTCRCRPAGSCSSCSRR